MIQCFEFVFFLSGDFKTDPWITTRDAIAISNIYGLRSQIALSNPFLYDEHYVFHRKANWFKRSYGNSCFESWTMFNIPRSSQHNDLVAVLIRSSL